MTALEKAIEAITEQQSKMEKDSTPYFVGEQLKDILRSAPPSAAEIVLQDLGTKGMSVEDCEKKIVDYASKHRHGNQGCCPPTEADRIIREFYGIPMVGIDLANGPDFMAYAKPAQKQTKVSLADFL